VNWKQFVNQFKATIDKINDKFSYFQIVDGDEIGHIGIIRDNYYATSGTLGSSCMASRFT
jgi:hypothetical protein